MERNFWLISVCPIRASSHVFRIMALLCALLACPTLLYSALFCSPLLLSVNNWLASGKSLLGLKWRELRGSGKTQSFVDAMSIRKTAQNTVYQTTDKHILEVLNLLYFRKPLQIKNEYSTNPLSELCDKQEETQIKAECIYTISWWVRFADVKRSLRRRSLFTIFFNRL